MIKEIVQIFTVITVIISLIIGLCMWADFTGCHSRWDRAGFEAVEWGPLQGCMVRLKDGRWMPTDVLRDIDLPRGGK